ncbi:MAG: N-acetylmuramic acid 6-phosphate etherase [Neorhizobium sp.]|nr:N-acetylmuramic acid 6-phosphate etherase [Neorhizobium sp.]
MATATEARHARSHGLDTLAPSAILALLSEGQRDAVLSVDRAIPQIERAAALMARVLGDGGRLVYAGAGSAGLVAIADALELPGTYGIERDRIRLLFAGGLPTGADLPGGPEDDAALGERDAAIISAGDLLLCVSASGSTPYTLAVARVAKQNGASVVGIANNPGAPLFAGADVAILLETPAEVVAGSTRMGAASAQKVALNMISTLAAIKLGHVHDGHMVNLRADNAKLRIRAARMVADIAGIEIEDAAAVVEKADGSIKVAVLLAAGVSGAAEARTLLAQSADTLRIALGKIDGSAGHAATPD